MSTPRCLRTAIEACRPCKTSTYHLHPRIASSQIQQTRDFSSSTPRCKREPIDIFSGFRTPAPGEITLNDPLPKDKVPAPERRDAVSQTTASPSTNQSSKQEGAEASEAAVQRAQRRQQLREKLSPFTTTSNAPRSQPAQQEPTTSPPALAETASEEPTKPLVPPNVLAAYRTPLRHQLVYGVPVAQLQLRSYSARNLEFYADFCVRAAYYLGLPCTGPFPLPKRTERWTVLKSNFVNKKAQENFERITLKRLLTVYDGEASVVETWLAFLRKWQYHGVGMKANVWQWEGLDVSTKMERDFHSLEKELDDKLQLFGFSKSAPPQKKDLLGLMERQGHRRVGVGMSEVREGSRASRHDPW